MQQFLLNPANLKTYLCRSMLNATLFKRCNPPKGFNNWDTPSRLFKHLLGFKFLHECHLNSMEKNPQGVQ